ncbi:MAG: GNAT family N-acetyltransferase, partial [Oscillospiraceae bacterium]|nr:GNAT family N-acetyltransferase [Oscillospiraceae bacterium]
SVTVYVPGSRSASTISLSATPSFTTMVSVLLNSFGPVIVNSYVPSARFRARSVGVALFTVARFVTFSPPTSMLFVRLKVTASASFPPATSTSAGFVPAGTVPFTQYIAVREEDGKVIGALQIRHYLKGDFALYAGHIGYSVRPSQRRKGYGTQMLRLALQRCRDMGIDRVMISCVDTNETSRRTILKCGGAFDSTYYYSAADQTIEKYLIAL